MILIDKDGQHVLKNGLKDKSFFIYPYQQIYTQQWSNDLKKDHGSTSKVDRFDTRNQCKYPFEFALVICSICFPRYGL